MKKRISFKNFWPDFVPDDLGPIFTNNTYLKNENIELLFVKNDPDIIIYGNSGSFLFNANKDSPSSIKILFITEPISPNFYTFDYCMGFEPYDFGGRNCFYPHYIFTMREPFPKLSTFESEKILKKKKYFCDFIYSHNGNEISRKEYFDLLSTYKTVISAGTYLNNTPDGKSIKYLEKFKLQNLCKFSLCIQSVFSKDYFINEKIIHSLIANEIPIFFGPKSAKQVFNKKRIIFADEFTNEELIQKIIEIDNDDSLFCKILSEPVFNDPLFYEKTIDNACRFIYEIVTEKKGKQLIYRCKEQTIRDEYLDMSNYYQIVKKKQSSQLYCE